MIGSQYEINIVNIIMKDVTVQSPFNLMIQIGYIRLMLPFFLSPEFLLFILYSPFHKLMRLILKQFRFLGLYNHFRIQILRCLNIFL